MPLDLPALCRNKLRQCYKDSNDYNDDNGVSSACKSDVMFERFHVFCSSFIFE